MQKLLSPVELVLKCLELQRLDSGDLCSEFAWTELCVQLPDDRQAGDLEHDIDHHNG